MRTSCGRIVVVFLFLFVPVCSRGGDVSGPSVERRVVNALRTEEKILVDGNLSELDWERADKARDFFRVQPDRGVLAELSTEAMVLYDDATLYVGFRCFEPDMTRLRETLTRRDAEIWEDDGVEVILDTYDDDRNGYVFAVNTLGTQMDEHIGNESVYSLTWDARWEARVMKGEDFWSAEFAIPFSELRFSTESSTWGINFWRNHPIDGNRIPGPIRGEISAGYRSSASSGACHSAPRRIGGNWAFSPTLPTGPWRICPTTVATEWIFSSNPRLT